MVKLALIVNRIKEYVLVCDALAYRCRGGCFSHVGQTVRSKKAGPVSEGEVIEVGEENGGQPASVRYSTGRNILLVEDNETNRLNCGARYLQKAGFDPDVATNGVEAVRASKKKAYDLILMDISMAEMDGIEATRLVEQMVSMARMFLSSH